MNIPDSVTILDGAFAMDGGSICLQVSDPSDRRYCVLLSQHLLPTGCESSRLPGRLYFDGEMIDVRSEDETSLISALKEAVIHLSTDPDRGSGPTSAEQPGMIVGEDIKAYFAKIAEGPASALRHLVAGLIEYVESAEYVAFATRKE